MTARRDVDRVIATWLTEIAPEVNVDYLDETLVAIDRVRQRPVWASPRRWLPMQMTLPRVVVPRAAPYLALLALLLIGVIVALAIAGGQKRLPAPFGLAANGLVAFESEGDILVANRRRQRPPAADRRARRPMEPDLLAPRRSDRVLVGTESRGPRVALRGRGGRLERAPRDRRADVPCRRRPPAVTWSPDDRRLAFSSDAGDLYVVNADGSDLHRLGDAHPPTTRPRLVARRHADRLYRAAAGRSVLDDVQLGDHARRKRRPGGHPGRGRIRDRQRQPELVPRRAVAPRPHGGIVRRSRRRHLDRAARRRRQVVASRHRR